MFVPGNASVARLSHDAANAGTASRPGSIHRMYFIVKLYIAAPNLMSLSSRCCTQNVYFKAPCKIRGSSAERICPNVELFLAAVGVINPAVEVAVPFPDRPLGGPQFT